MIKFDKAAEIAKNIFWVGCYLKNEPFHSLVYLIKNGDESILIDPGSMLGFDCVVEKIKSIIPMNQIKFLILHDFNPSHSASISSMEKRIGRSDLQIITHSKMTEFFRHYVTTSSYYEIDKNDFRLVAENGLELDFYTTPYSPSPGAFVTYFKKGKLLFSSNLFGGFSKRWNLYCDDAYFDLAKEYHLQYMPSKNIQNYSLRKLEALDLDLIAPQFGSVITREYIPEIIEQLKALNCGMDMERPHHRYLDDAIEELKSNRLFLRTVIESSNNAIISINKYHKVVIYNKKAEQVFGYSKEEMLGRDSLQLIIPEFYFNRHEEALNHFVQTQKFSGAIGKEHFFQAKRKNGDIFPIQISFGVEIIHDDFVIVANIVDRTEEEKRHNELLQQYEILNYQANHDMLTGLPNRKLFVEKLSEMIEASQKDSSQHFAIFYLDLDSFKGINDSFGHDVGDSVLIAVTKMLKERLTGTETFARFGGDEFVILVQDDDGYGQSKIYAQKILDLFNDPIIVNNQYYYLSASIGISVYPKDGEDPKILIRNADTAMYYAKNKGRNRLEFYFPEMTENAISNVMLENELHDALLRKEFVVYYQPQIDSSENRIVGIEALIRWKHPSKGFLLPENFINIAEKTGMIVQLDRWEMAQAMRQMVEWHDLGYLPGKISLNLAIRQLYQKDFISFIKELLIETGFKAEWMILEIRENQIMENHLQAMEILQEISDLGIEIAIDDFGTGYSSLAYLKHFPVDKLKIDKSFVQNIPKDSKDVAIVKTIITLAESLNISVIAEGVETVEQRGFLLEAGCHEIQGYLIGKPCSKEEIVNYF
ncbi:MAG: EAL domain-containing protein [Campylobacterota bacterium]|nr:EAL domain-containing protein [Campylobacterota bacterium]